MFQERYNPLILGVNATAQINGSGVGGFLCVASGTITLTNANGKVIVNAFPVTGGVYHPMPFFLDGNGGTVALSGGAAGTLGQE